MAEIKKNNVSSSNLEAVGYDEPTQTLRVWFLNGAVYDYSNVPITEFEMLIDAASVGGYLHRNIKGSYPYIKVG